MHTQWCVPSHITKLLYASSWLQPPFYNNLSVTWVLNHSLPCHTLLTRRRQVAAVCTTYQVDISRRDQHLQYERTKDRDLANLVKVRRRMEALSVLLMRNNATITAHKRQQLSVMLLWIMVILCPKLHTVPCTLACCSSLAPA